MPRKDPGDDPHERFFPPSVDGLDDDLGWALGVVSRRYRELALGAVSELPAGPRGYHVLRAVAAGPPRSQLALARRLGIDKTVMTYLVDDLEGAGLVARHADPRDRRARRVSLTPSGEHALALARQQVSQAEAELLGVLGDGDAARLRSILARLARPATTLAPPVKGSGEHVETACP